ncbi:MAG: acyl carrier protein [Methylobacteriaceae bacterium]|nr:acyl carrier protein [Methylobacteriaceae bacterium]
MRFIFANPKLTLAKGLASKAKGQIVADLVHQVFAQVLKLAPSDITDETSPDNTSQWDSLAAMNLVAAIEEGFSVELTTREIMSMRTVGMARLVLRKKGVAGI